MKYFFVGNYFVAFLEKERSHAWMWKWYAMKRNNLEYLPKEIERNYVFREVSKDKIALTMEGKAYAWEYILHSGVKRFRNENKEPIFEINSPRPVLGEHIFTKISSSGHTVALTPEGKAYIWGLSSWGEYSTGMKNIGAAKPKAILPELTFEMVKVGFGFSVGLTTEGKIYTWGENDCGQLGDGTRRKRTQPKEICSEQVFSQVEVYACTVIAITTEGKMYAWGENNDGKLCIKNTTDESIKTPMPIMEELTCIDAHIVPYGDVMWALTASGEVYQWGILRNKGRVERLMMPSLMADLKI